MKAFGPTETLAIVPWLLVFFIKGASSSRSLAVRRSHLAACAQQAGKVPTIGIELWLWQTVFASRQHGMCGAILCSIVLKIARRAGILEQGVRTTSIKQPCWARHLW